MNGSSDDDRPWGEDGRGSLDVRELLEEASWPPAGRTVEAEDAWVGGRRRRSRKRAGAGVVAGVAALGMAGLVWQTGFFGGTTGEQEPHVATVPSGMTTFVLAGEGTAGLDEPTVDVSTISALSVPTAQELVGTSWVLTDQVYGSDQVASQVIGAETDTVFTFSEEYWGFESDGCGGASDQGPVEVDADGVFPPSPGLATTDLGCPEPAQTAEDFWMQALAEGGSLHLLGGGDWLLLSVDVPAGVAPPPEVVGTEDPSAGPSPGEDDGPSGETPTGETPAGEEPTGETPRSGEPSGEQPSGEQPSGEEPSSERPTTPSDPGTGVLAGFIPADEESISDGWPGGDGQLFAPSVRAGRGDGFDRVVVDLTGTGTTSWYAAYPETALRDGSGLPVQIAGDSVLEVVLGGMALPEPGDPVYDDGDFGLDTHGLDGVYEVIRTTPFEGQLQLFIGLDGEPRPYRVFLLQDPMRLVVDIQHAG